MFPAGGNGKNRPFAVFRLLVVAAWLRCSAEIPPPLLVPLKMHVDPGCLLPSVSFCTSPIQFPTLTLLFLLSLFFLSVFCSLFVSFHFVSLFSNLPPLSSSFSSYSFHSSLLAWDSERKVALELCV